MSHFLHNRNPFIIFGREHIMVLIITSLVTITLSVAAVHWWTPAQTLTANQTFTLILSATVIGWTAIHWSQGHFKKEINLPFDLCNLMAITLPLSMWHPTQFPYEVLYFLILGGTVQAVLTPDLPEGFPHYTFFKYWLVHCGLVIYIIFTTAAFGLRPTSGGIFNAFLAIQLYLVFALTINYCLGSNYLYVTHKPPQPSILDILGPWPWYVIAADILSVPLFFLLYLPFQFWPL